MARQDLEYPMKRFWRMARKSALKDFRERLVVLAFATIPGAIFYAVLWCLK